MSADTSTIRWLRIIVFAGLAAYSLMFLYHGVRLVMYPYDVDNSEAYLVHQGERIANGEFLYPPIAEEPFLVDNYPPVYPIVLAFGDLLFGTGFHWGRFVSLCATVWIAIVIGLWIGELTKNKAASVYGGLIFLSFYHVYDWCALARVDSLGVLLTVVGLVLAQKNWHWAVVMLCMLLALFTKQSLFAAPLAVFFFYGYTQKKKAWLFASVLACSGLLLFGLLAYFTNGEIYNHLILYNQNDYRMSDLIYYTRFWVGTYTVWGCAPLLVLALGWSQYRANENDSPLAIPLLLFIYTGVSIMESLLCGKIGSAPNYLLSLVCATSVCLGLIFHFINKSMHHATAWAAVFFFLLNIMQLAGTFHFPASGQMMFKHPLDFAYTPSTIDRQAAALLQNRLKRIDSPVLSDRAGVALAAGHTPVYQPFIFTQLSHQELWDQSNIINPLQNKKYKAVVLVFDVSRPNWDRERFTEAFIHVVRTNYTMTQQYGTYYLYLPKLDETL